MWAGPAQINGQDSAHQGKVGPNAAQPKILLQSGPGTAQTCRAGPALAAQRGENYFSPPCLLHAACRRQSCNGQKRNEMCTWRGGCGRWWRPVAVSWLTDGGSSDAVAVPTRQRERVFVLFPSPLFFVPSFSVRLTRDHSLLFSVLFKKTSFCSFCFPVVSLSLQFFSGPLLSPQPFFFTASSLFFFGFFSIYRGRTGTGTIGSAPGSGFRGWLQPPATARRRFFTFGRWSANDFGRWSYGLGPRAVRWRCRGERGGKFFFQKQSFSFCCRFGGERKKRNSVVQNGTVRSFLFFFFFYV